jgi:hypothetical protein
MTSLILLSIGILSISLFAETKIRITYYLEFSSKIDFISGSEYISNQDILNIHYNNYYFLNKELYKIINMNYMPNTHINYSEYPYNYKKVEKIINTIYKRYIKICSNKDNIYDMKDIYTNSTVNLYCNFNTNITSNSNIYNILYKIVKNCLIYNSYIIILKIIEYIYKYNERKKNKLNIDEYSKQIEYLQEECSICCSEYEKEDNIRQLLICNHIYHKECINDWIYSYDNRTCPLCRKKVDLI